MEFLLSWLYLFTFITITCNMKYDAHAVWWLWFIDYLNRHEIFKSLQLFQVPKFSISTATSIKLRPISMLYFIRHTSLIYFVYSNLKSHIYNSFTKSQSENRWKTRLVKSSLRVTYAF